MLSKYGCEDTHLTLECADKTVIKIVRANFGRFSSSICGGGDGAEWNYNCMQRRTKSVLDRRWGENFIYML